jgi:MFS family permease
LLVGSGSAIWLLVAVTLIVGVPQGLNSLANQNALYHQADPARMGSSAGLLQTCTYLGAIIAAAAGGAFLGHGADTRGLHHRALFTLAVAVLFLVAILPDRSELINLINRGHRVTGRRAGTSIVNDLAGHPDDTVVSKRNGLAAAASHHPHRNRPQLSGARRAIRQVL